MAEESRSDGQTQSNASSDQGIMIEMGESNDVAINATHLTVKCDNLILSGHDGQKVSARTSGQVPRHDLSFTASTQVPVKRERWMRLPSPRQYAMLAAALTALRTARQISNWHWTRYRTERALSRESAHNLVALLSTHDKRAARAVLVHLTLDVQNTSNFRLQHPTASPFLSVSDLELSRASAVESRASTTGYSRKPNITGPRPTSSLSISSIDTTPSCDSSAARRVCVQMAETADSEPVEGSTNSVTTLKPDTSTRDPVTCPSVAAHTELNNVGSEASGKGSVCGQACAPGGCVSERSMSVDAGMSGSAYERAVDSSSKAWSGGVPVEGRALAMLSQQSAVWDAFVALLRRNLIERHLPSQRDAAWAVQVVAFASERLAQRLVNAGMIRYRTLWKQLLRGKQGSKYPDK